MAARRLPLSEDEDRGKKGHAPADVPISSEEELPRAERELVQVNRIRRFVVIAVHLIIDGYSVATGRGRPSITIQDLRGFVQRDGMKVATDSRRAHYSLVK